MSCSLPFGSLFKRPENFVILCNVMHGITVKVSTDSFVCNKY